MGSMEEIVAALKRVDSDWSKETLSKLSKMSPTSLKVHSTGLQLAFTGSLGMAGLDCCRSRTLRFKRVLGMTWQDVCATSSESSSASSCVLRPVI